MHISRSTRMVAVAVAVAVVTVVAASCTCRQSDLSSERNDWTALEQELPRLDKREQARRLEVFLETHPPNKKRTFGTHSRTPRAQALLRLSLLREAITREEAQ